MFVCLSVGLPEKKLICMKLLQEVCLGPRKNGFDFGDDPEVTIRIHDRNYVERTLEPRHHRLSITSLCRKYIFIPVTL